MYVRTWIHIGRTVITTRMITAPYRLPRAREGILLEARPLKDAPAQAVRPVPALAARPHAALVLPAAQEDGAGVLIVQGPRAVLVDARGRQPVGKVDGAARAKVPLDRVVPAEVVVWVGCAHDCLSFFSLPSFLRKLSR